ncbi:MAG: pirin family protein [Xanthomonadales bacterium]|nr:pirin family protein [Xanthomonadales bacterium]
MNQCIREISQRFPGRPAEDGAGVRLTRFLDPSQARLTDPFLMLDEFRSDVAQDYIAGFPMHPHRGFETVTCMIQGRMRHRDNQGNTGDLGPGSVQWMSAARGIVHEEMPQQENGLLWGYQLWLNLPSRDKMAAPRYQDIDATQIPQSPLDGGGHVRIIAGNYADVPAAVTERATAAHLLDLHLPAGKRFCWSAPAGHTVLLQGVVGMIRVGSTKALLQERELVLLGDGTELELIANADARVLVFTGTPIGEPTPAYAPFVMNSAAEVRQAFEDFRAGRF